MFSCFGFSRFLDTVTFYVKIWWEIGRLKEGSVVRGSSRNSALDGYDLCMMFNGGS